MGEPIADLVSLPQLRCFLATVRAGSFTGAAARLDVTQPAIAEQIRKLEGDIGIELFTRTGRGVRLTAAGIAFAERAPAVLRALDDALASVIDVGTLRSGTLAFGLFATPEAYGIDRLASAFAHRYPGIVLRLVGRNSSTAADRVRDGELEAALVTLPIDDRGLDVEPLVRDEVVYVSANPAHTRHQVTIEQLSRRSLILYDLESGDRDPLRRQLIERAQKRGLRLVASIETETMVMALRLAAQGVGDTYVPRAHTRASYFPASLTSTPFRPAVHESFAIVSRRGVRMSPATQVFAAGIRQHMAALEEELASTNVPAMNSSQLST